MCVSVYEEELRKFDSYLTLLRLKYIALYRTFYGCSLLFGSEGFKAPWGLPGAGGGGSHS